jgi:flavin reductase (DIM6/NTAB) family NADH-FMN oxidoreductase RutF/rubredoxin
MTVPQNNASMNFEAFFKISYGLYVVSSKNGTKLNGYVSNAVFQVTAEPAQFAVCCSKNNYTAELINKSKAFSISVLKQEASPELIGVFGYQSGKEIDKFKDVEFITGSTGVPILTQDSLAWFECKVIQTVDVGTHFLFTAEIVDNDLIDGAGEPLTYSYYREVRKGKAPKNAPTYINPEPAEKTADEKEKFKCLICGHIYDPELGDPEHNVPAGTDYSDLPEDWQCPVCGADKYSFDLI